MNLYRWNISAELLADDKDGDNDNLLLLRFNL